MVVESSSSKASTGSLTPSTSQNGSNGFSRPSSPTESNVEYTNIDISTILPLPTRYVFCELTATVLRLDFLDKNDATSVNYCKKVQQFILEFCGLDIPEKSRKIFFSYLVDDVELPDIASLIVAIKKDPVVIEKGASIILGSLLYRFVLSGNYDSRSRVLLRHLSTLLAVVWEEFEKIEDSFVSILLEDEFVESEQSIKAREKIAKSKKLKRYLMIGAAGGVGGVLIGLTGGLAAPLVAAGAGVVLGGAATVIGTTAGAALLGTTFGITGAGLAGYKMKKRVGAIEEFSIEPLTNGHALTCILVVSGWIDDNTTSEQAFLYPWRHLIQSKEQYSLHYESKYLAELGKAMEYLMACAVSVGIQQTLMQTALAALVSAVAWPVAILSCASVLDNPWNVCIARSAEVGEQLAEVLLSRAHGTRPISLIGFSLGARVIYHCLMAMSKRGENTGIIEDVILLGAPVSAAPSQWNEISQVVGGRIINGYCETDWLLRFVYRTMSVQFAIAGTSPVNVKNRKIVNYNVSHIIKGHLDYSKKLTEILEAVGVRVSPHSPESHSSLVSICEPASEVEEKSKLSDESPSPPAPLEETLKEIKVRDHAFHEHDNSYSANEHP